MTTLPGTIPGLLRRGSPVKWRDEETPWQVLAVGEGMALLAPCDSLGLVHRDNISNMALDLSDPTGRVHAAWWALDFMSVNVLGSYKWSMLAAVCLAPKADEHTESLRSLVLRLAGVEG